MMGDGAWKAGRLAVGWCAAHLRELGIPSGSEEQPLPCLGGPPCRGAVREIEEEPCPPERVAPGQRPLAVWARHRPGVCPAGPVV